MHFFMQHHSDTKLGNSNNYFKETLEWKMKQILLTICFYTKAYGFADN
jgi:hypothetical protein